MYVSVAIPITDGCALGLCDVDAAALGAPGLVNTPSGRLLVAYAKDEANEEERGPSASLVNRSAGAIQLKYRTV